MIGDQIISDSDLAAAAHMVRVVFSENISTDDGLELLRDVFGEVWPHWTDAQLLLALRAALILH